MDPLETILYNVVDNVATITLNRPKVLNAVNRQLSEELGRALSMSGEDPSVRVVVLKGAGRAFSAGADLKERFSTPGMKPNPEGEIAHLRSVVPYMKIWELNKPVIASVHGYCLAGACQMAGVCDITIASDDALFGEPEVKFANPILIPISAVLLGLKKAKEFLFLGELMSAFDAERLGLVNRVVPRDQLDIETAALAQKLAAIPTVAIQLNKRAINKVWELMGFRQSVAINEELLAYVSAYQATIADGNDDPDEGFRHLATTQDLRTALGKL